MPTKQAMHGIGFALCTYVHIYIYYAHMYLNAVAVFVVGGAVVLGLKVGPAVKPLGESHGHDTGEGDEDLGSGL
jgi:hypothetical protein